MSTTATLIGWVDRRRRPLVNLRFKDDRIVCAAIDTGFNGYLLREGTPANLPELPGELGSLYETVEVAGGHVFANLASTSIQWLDRDGIEVDMLVVQSDKQHQPGDPVVFVGTALMAGTTLVVDFVEGTVRIQRSS